jgi:catecholate siderophore receptor
MRGAALGVAGYRTAKGVRAALALAAGAAALGGGAAHADEAGAAVAAEISGLTITGARQPLDQDTGLATSLTTVRETPQAVSVIDQAQLKAQGVNTLEQALRTVPGITIAIGEGGTLNGDQFKIRGFDAKDDVYVDGLRDFGVYTRDSFAYEEVQVLKGPSGAMFGRGTTGGAINTLSKQPRLEGRNEIDLYAGNGDYYRALADFDRRLGETSAVRLNLMASNTGVVDRDLIYSKRWGAALTAGFGLGTDTTVVASYLHQHDHRRPDYGIVVVQRPGELTAKPASEYDVGVERSSFLGFRNDVDSTDADILTVRVSHQASARLSFTSDTRYGVYSRYFQYSTLDQCNAACTTALFDNNPATEAFGGIGGSSPYQMDAWGLQNISTVRYDGDVGPLRNQAIVGFDLSKQVNDKTFFAYTLPPKVTTRPNMPHPIVNPDPVFPAGYGVFTPIPGQNLDCSGPGNCTTAILGPTVFSNVTGTQTWKSRGESDDAGVFFTDRLWLTEQLSVIGSVRYDRYTAKLESTLYSGAASPPGGLKVTSDLTSPRVSLVFEPNDQQTWYASWGRSQTPQGTSIVGAGTALTVSAKDLEPEDSEIVEAGAKLTIPHTRLLATASVFRITKDNALQVDPATGFLQAQSGERQEVKGVELGLTGLVTPNWTVSAGYSYLDARIEQSFANCSVPTSTAGVPTNIVCPVGVTAAIPVANPVATGRQVAFVPKHSASLYTIYDLSEWIDGLKVGGDVIYQSKLYLTYGARSLSFADRGTLVPARIAEVPESVTLDAFASWDRGPYRLSLNLYNLADRLNYTQVFSNRAIPAPGRTVIVSIGARF